MKTALIVSSCSIIFFMHAVAQTSGTFISLMCHGNTALVIASPKLVPICYVENAFIVKLRLHPFSLV